jgi:hypothetical protein
MKEIYGIVIANTGISPAYFLDEMEWFEIEAVLNEISENKKDRWEQTRQLATKIVNCFSVEDKYIEATSIMPLPWDEKKTKVKIAKEPPPPELVETISNVVNDFYKNGSKET